MTRGLASSLQRDLSTHSLKLLPASNNLILCIHTFCVPSAKQYNLYQRNRNKYPWNGFHKVKTMGSTMDRSQSPKQDHKWPRPLNALPCEKPSMSGSGNTGERDFHSRYWIPPNLLGADHAGLVAYDSAPNPDILRRTT